MNNTCAPTGFQGYEEMMGPKETPKFIKKKKFSLLCNLFGHKYVNITVLPGIFEATCKRCGKERDVHPPKKKPKEDEQQATGAPDVMMDEKALKARRGSNRLQEIAHLEKVNKTKKTVKKLVKK